MLKRYLLVLLGLLLGIGAGYLWQINTNQGEASSFPVRRDTAGKHERYTIVTFDLPHKLDFAGETIPLNDPDVRERLDRELHINTYWNSSTVFIFKRANRWFPQIEAILEEEGIPDDFKYLPVIESSLTNAVSPAQAVGFWQLLAATAREHGLEVNGEVDERYHPLKSTRAACAYLKRAHAKFGNWTTVAASYNAGVRGITREMLRQEAGHYYDLLLNEETGRYVFRVLAIKEIMNNPETYGYYLPEQHLYDPEPVRKVQIDTTVQDLVEFAHQQGISYKTLKRHNPWLRSNTLTIKSPGDSYEIAIPVNKPGFVRLESITDTISD